MASIIGSGINGNVLANMPKLGWLRMASIIGSGINGNS